MTIKCCRDESQSASTLTPAFAYPRASRKRRAAMRYLLFHVPFHSSAQLWPTICQLATLFLCVIRTSIVRAPTTTSTQAKTQAARIFYAPRISIASIDSPMKRGGPRFTNEWPLFGALHTGLPRPRRLNLHAASHWANKKRSFHVVGFYSGALSFSLHARLADLGI
ncbi:hypothetical protein PLICRDRAFT_510919 [Plicaturopsis crispa FD-325 SS-3]|nr:hypothetical protein PLICRDRAFT_510919 [Plicaturopsis crispa FD-325 SS-3]